MLASLSPEHCKFVTIETLLGASFNCFLPGLGMWIFGGYSSIVLWGADGAARALIIPTLAPSLLMPVILTLIVRWRVAKGNAPALGQSAVPSVIRRIMPAPIWGRAAVSVILPFCLLLPAALSCVHVFGLDPLNRAQFIILNMVCGFMTGCLVLPPVLIAALADHAQVKS